MKDKAFKSIIAFFSILEKRLYEISLQDRSNVQYDYWNKKNYTFLTEKDLYNITKLDLSYSSLVQIPSELAFLTTLESLDISGNYISELPEWIWELNNLKVLRLGSSLCGGNNIKNISSKIKKLKNLEILDIRYNDNLQELPSELLQLDELLYFSLTQDSLYDSDVVRKLQNKTKCCVMFEEALPPLEELL
ncbi:leucine-rich repeat domain-containing protein [Sulfurimonas sp.]